MWWETWEYSHSWNNIWINWFLSILIALFLLLCLCSYIQHPVTWIVCNSELHYTPCSLFALPKFPRDVCTLATNFCFRSFVIRVVCLQTWLKRIWFFTYNSKIKKILTWNYKLKIWITGNICYHQQDQRDISVIRFSRKSNPIWSYTLCFNIISPLLYIGV